MSIVGGLDIHRKQLTFDYLDTDTGELRRGQVSPADRNHLAGWLQRFDGRTDVTFAVEACTGWRYVVHTLQRAGITAQLAEPADTAAARGPKRRAKTDRADARLLRELACDGRVPQCWIPPVAVLEHRALLECYHDLRREHTAWVQRIHATCFHHGTAALGTGGIDTADGRARLRRITEAELSPAAQVQITVALAMLDTLETHLEDLRRRLVSIARHLHGARVLTDPLYGVGPITALALCCWLGGAGRFTSSRQAVRFTGLDVTVYSSDGKRTPGHLSRQGPPVLRWCVYEAGKTHARNSAPDHAYYAQVADRVNGKRAAISEARKLVRQAHHILADLGDAAFTTA
ncbi:IS110 family transposase [Actinoplanes subtropicus]|uniref:IS110 family transposase n=1 Tax=Actinoplanes subtropicus TaxID=543632 RepID=UPI0004C36862|nr:IS110 family transposase [Actinoplanes subtropicus]